MSPDIGFAEAIALTPADGGRLMGVCEEASAGRGYGGHAMALALAAAQHDIPPGRRTLSARAWFPRPITPLEPITFTVRADGDSRSFSRRAVRAEQHGKEVLAFTAEFIVPDDEARSFQLPMPDVACPAELEPEVVGRVEIAQVEGDAINRGALRDPARQRVWNRIPEALPDDAGLHACALLYLSDATQLWLTMTANGIPFRRRSGMISSVEHGMWFHRPIAADTWSLYDQVCPSTSDGVGMVQGNLFGADGVLGATVSQVGVLRPPAN